MKLDSNNRKHNVRLLTIIGEIEGHEAVSGNTKATKYEHLLPMLAEVEDSEEIDGRGCGSRTIYCRDDRFY